MADISQGINQLMGMALRYALAERDRSEREAYRQEERLWRQKIRSEDVDWRKYLNEQSQLKYQQSIERYRNTDERVRNQSIKDILNSNLSLTMELITNAKSPDEIDKYISSTNDERELADKYGFEAINAKVNDIRLFANIRKNQLSKRGEIVNKYNEFRREVGKVKFGSDNIDSLIDNIQEYQINQAKYIDKQLANGFSSLIERLSNVRDVSETLTKYPEFKNDPVIVRAIETGDIDKFNSRVYSLLGKSATATGTMPEGISKDFIGDITSLKGEVQNFKANAQAWNRNLTYANEWVYQPFSDHLVKSTDEWLSDPGVIGNIRSTAEKNIRRIIAAEEIGGLGQYSKDDILGVSDTPAPIEDLLRLFNSKDLKGGWLESGSKEDYQLWLQNLRIYNKTNEMLEKYGEYIDKGKGADEGGKPVEEVVTKPGDQEIKFVGDLIGDKEHKMEFIRWAVTNKKLSHSEVFDLLNTRMMSDENLNPEERRKIDKVVSLLDEWEEFKNIGSVDSFVKAAKADDVKIKAEKRRLKETGGYIPMTWLNTEIVPPGMIGEYGRTNVRNISEPQRTQLNVDNMYLDKLMGNFLSYAYGNRDYSNKDKEYITQLVMNIVNSDKQIDLPDGALIKLPSGKSIPMSLIKAFIERFYQELTAPIKLNVESPFGSETYYDNIRYRE